MVIRPGVTWAEKQPDGTYKIVSSDDPKPGLVKPVQAVADRLVGTCMESVESACEDLGFDDVDGILGELDDYIFECEGCGWWCDVEELNNTTDQNLCDECNDDED